MLRRSAILSIVLSGAFSPFLSYLSAHPITRPVVLEGTVVTPEGVIPNGRVLIEGERIKAVGANISVPEGSILVRTGGLIYPGLIDLHNHITWNLFPRWTPPKVFNNRYQWRDSKEYKSTYSKWNQALKAVNCERNKYGELKALIGGVTSIQGSLANNSCVKGLVRNLDYYSGLYEKSKLRQEKLYHVLDIDSLDGVKAGELKKKIEASEITAFLIHLSEGTVVDKRSKKEFSTLSNFGLVGGATGIIHGTAFGDEEFKLMKEKGANVIWSPKSNLELYKQTTNIQEALKNNVLVALAPDWSITGSDNILGELKVARNFNSSQPEKIWKEDKDLVLMVTINPAKIAALEDKIGKIKEGYFADLLVIRGNLNEPYKSLVEAKEEDVELVLVGGQPHYGGSEIMTKLGQDQDSEPMAVCGSKKLLHLTHHDVKENPLNVTFKELLERLNKAASDLTPSFQLAPLFQCE